MLNRLPNCGEMCSLYKTFWTDPKREMKALSFWNLGIEGKVRRNSHSASITVFLRMCYILLLWLSIEHLE